MVSDSQADRRAPDTYLADQYSDTIDAIYLHALHENPTIRNRVAYAGYLASHGRVLDGLKYFKQIMQDDALMTQPALRNEVGERISHIETRLKNDRATWPSIRHA